MPAMHLIIAFAADTCDAARAAQQQLKLPHLQALLRRLVPGVALLGEADSLSPPHERALAHALGLPVVDGLLPWAALRAASRPEGQVPEGAWGFITLCHWQLDPHAVIMRQIPMQDMPADESDALLAAMRPYFQEDGIALYPDQPGRWLACGAPLTDLATAAPDRVLARDLAQWLPRSAAAAPLRRLQNEMQMLLYTHPVNDARAARGALAVNSFWLSGCGALPAGFAVPGASAQPQVHTTDALRESALAQDWLAWADAWQRLDAGVLAELLQTARSGQPVQLSLCGERHARQWISQRRSIWQKISGHFGIQPISNVLDTL